MVTPVLAAPEVKIDDALMSAGAFRNLRNGFGANSVLLANGGDPPATMPRGRILKIFDLR